MIKPWFEASAGREISYGISSYGTMLAGTGGSSCSRICMATIIDQKAMDERCFHDVRGDSRHPAQQLRARGTVERFRIPRDVMVICLGKSMPGAGIIVNVTPLEPGWQGHVTLEISNATPLPARVYANEGICQFVFLRGSTSRSAPMPSAGGIYQGQSGITLPRLAGGAQDADLGAAAGAVAQDGCLTMSRLGGLAGASA